jgi:hypothetical protein
MSNTFQQKNHSIVVSLNERTIYFKVTDTISFYQYEGNIDAKELRLNIELTDSYKIIVNCLNLEHGYNNQISVNSGILKMQFNALVGGFLKMNFEIQLREKIMSNDGQLTLNFNRLEQKLNAGLQRLLERCDELETIIEKNNEEIIDLTDKLSFAHICLTYSGHPQPSHFIPINTKELSGQFSNDGASFKYDLIEKLYQLKKLQTNHFRCSDFASVKMKNKTLNELSIQCHGEGQFCSLRGIHEMPDLESLTIMNAPNLTDIPTVLSSYKSKINHIKIQTCAKVNVVELQTYCQTNNIKLEIS